MSHAPRAPPRPADRRLGDRRKQLSFPPLLLTHVPLLLVPHGAVNVHGHVHEQESPTPNRHVNVSAEQLTYRPTNPKESALYKPTRRSGDEPSVVRRLLKKLGIARARGRKCMCENPKGPGVETSTQGPQRGNRR